MVEFITLDNTKIVFVGNLPVTQFYKLAVDDELLLQYFGGHKTIIPNEVLQELSEEMAYQMQIGLF